MIDRVNGVLREQITGIRVVRAFVREPEETERFAGANDELTATALRTGRLMAAMFPTVLLIINVSSIAVLWIGADYVNQGELQIGSLIAYLTYLIQILFAVVMATFLVSMIPRASVASDRVAEVLGTPIVGRASRAPDHRGRRARHARVPQRRLLVPGRRTSPCCPTSRSVSTAGQTTAIIGSTGSGKSTLVNLVSRLFDATSGTVLVDGVDVRELDPDLLWSKVGYVPQKPFLFSGTVASQPALRAPGRHRRASCGRRSRSPRPPGSCRRCPTGIDSEITQGGTNVSGGQRQRLSIARALVVRPEIYVFDDSFSALDLGTDARLRAALDTAHLRVGGC